MENSWGVDWKRGTIKIAGVENAGVENAAPSSGAYSGFEFRWCEAKESRGRKFPSGIQKQSPVGSVGDRPRKLKVKREFLPAR